MRVTVHEIMILGAMALATMLTRFLPFVVFPAAKKTPRYIDYLGKTLPYATMGLLMVYCLKEVNPASAPFCLPEVLAILVILVLHRWKGNPLLSIGAGTVLYMILVQFIFV